jgi:hypothetical protein
LALDFTLQSYTNVLCAAKDAGYQTCAVIDWLDGSRRNDSKLVVLRHDVDRRPNNALAMAKLEAARGIRATYYFRIVPVSFVPDIVKEIAALGHEIGYHYEDWHRGDYQLGPSLALFKEALARLREVAQIRSISMHGSPMAKENNMAIWNHADFQEHSVLDCCLSDKWTSFAYFTDSGRTFGQTSANLRDVLADAESVAEVGSTADLVSYIRSGRRARMMISTHPERWSDKPLLWTAQWGRDAAANTAKLLLRAARSR